jgi:FlaA1/EpsC-like NDP-sugar epimerase
LNTLLHKILKLLFNEKLHTFGYLPRWTIFCIDVLILLIANFFTYILVINLSLNYTIGLGPLERYSIIVGVNIVFFILFKTYSGIIRHSSFIDAIKLLFSTFSSFLVLVFLKYIVYFFFGIKLFYFPGLILSFLLSFTFLFFFRILVKFAFEHLIKNESKDRLIRTVVFGSDANAIAIVNAIQSESPRRFEVVAFVDKLKGNDSKRLLGLPILFSNKKVSVIVRSLNAKALIIAEKSLSKSEKIAMVDDCLKYNVKVFTVPVITNWENDRAISKQIKSFEIQDLLERKPIVLDNKSISRQLSGKTVLITGAAGSIGSEIVWQVLQFSPKTIVLVDQAETPLHTLWLEIQKVTNEVTVVTVIADIRNKASIEKLFTQYEIDLVYHAAAYKHVPLMEANPSQAIQTNVLGTKNLADLSVAYGVKKFVMVSTDKAVNPSNVMGASKRIAEKYVQSLHLSSSGQSTKFITTRFGNVLGSNGSVVPLFKRQIESGGPITITHPDIIRYFMTIPEACQLVLEAGAMGNGGEIYLFDMGKPVKIIDLARRMIQLAGYEVNKEIKIEVVGLRPGEKLYEELLNDSAKTLPTHHSKILIAQEDLGDVALVKEAILLLIENVGSDSDVAIVQRMKAIVSEFKSLNSDFEHLDK